MVATPAARALRGLVQRTGSPRQLTAPPVGGIAPANILIRVDLPAPLAPSSPCTRPACTVRSTPRRATVPLGQTFSTPVSESKGVTIDRRIDRRSRASPRG